MQLQSSKKQIKQQQSFQLSQDESKKKTKQQLNRIKGQLDGVAQMIDQDRSCTEVIQQLLAIRSSLSSAAHRYISNNTVACASTSEDQKKLDMMLKRLFQL